MAWPMGVALSHEKAEPHGLVFQVGEEEAYGLKLQPPDTDEQTAKALYYTNLALVASALPFYLEQHHKGIMVPCAYYRDKTNNRFESGFAFFVGPHPASRPAAPREIELDHDDNLGDGASRMISDMIDAILKASQRIGLPISPPIGIDLRPRMALGMLGTPFLVHGPKVFAIQHPLVSEHPVWSFAVRAGFSKLPYAPMVTVAVRGRPNVPDAWLDRVKDLSQRLRGNG